MKQTNLEDPYDNTGDDEFSGEVDTGPGSDDDLPPTPPRPSTPQPAKGLPWTPKVRSVDVHSDIRWLEKIDVTWFLDQTDYLIGKLPDQTEVQIRTRIIPDSETYSMISTSLLFATGRQSIISDAIDEWCKRLQACICANWRYFEHLMRMFMFLRSEERSSELLRLVWSPRDWQQRFHIMQLPIRLNCSDKVWS